MSVRKILLLLLAGFTLGPSTWAAPLRIVEVAAPSINCVFDSDCRITVSDFTAPITLPGTSGEGFLQSRTGPPGEAGTVGEDLTPFEYRVDLRQIAGVTAGPCITELSVDFGPFQPLDYDGDGNAEDVYVVTRGGLGSVGLTSAEQVGDRIAFRFDPAVCSGNRPGDGESTFFFGLAAKGPAQAVKAQATVSLGGVLDLEARAPGGEDGGDIPPPGPALCFPGVPITDDVPVCRCLRDRGARELRCGLLHPDFLLVRRTPLPTPPGKPFPVRWSFAPLGKPSGTVVVEDGLAPGYRRPQGPARLKFGPGSGKGKTMTREYTVLPPPQGGKVSVPSLVTYKPRGGAGEEETFEILLPMGTQPWPTLLDVPSEPLPSPPADPEFGPGPCGKAADEHWEEHVEGYAGTRLGTSYKRYEEIVDLAKWCRENMPRFGRICRSSGQDAWADCVLGEVGNCTTVAEEAIERCRRFIVGGALDGILGGHRRYLLDLGP